MIRHLAPLTLALCLFWTATPAEATLFQTVGCAQILRSCLQSSAIEVVDYESTQDLFEKIILHYQEGEWIESRPSAREFIVGAGAVDRKRQYGGISRIGFYLDALENPERTGRVSVWAQYHEDFESMEKGAAGAMESLLRQWKIYCNQAEANLLDLLLASRLASAVTVGALMANETTMSFGQSLFQYCTIAYLGDWALRLIVASGVSYDAFDARARQLGHAFSVTREAFSKPASGSGTWAHFGVNLAENRKIDLIILRDPDEGPAFQTIVLGFDGIK